MEVDALTDSKINWPPVKKNDRLPDPFSDEENQKPGPFRPNSPDSSENVEDDEGFIRAAFRSDPKAGIELLFRRYYQPLCTHAVKFIGSKEAAEDLVGDIFCQFYAASGHLQVTTFLPVLPVPVGSQPRLQLPEVGTGPPGHPRRSLRTLQPGTATRPHHAV